MKDVAESVLARLLNIAKANGFVYNELRRKRPIPTESPVALTERFWSDPIKQKQWHAFLRKSRLNVGNLTLRDIAHEISDFLMPVVNRLNA